MRDITVHAVLNGWTVKVGCQTLVFNDRKTLLKDLGEYMANPLVKQKKFVEAAVNKILMDGPQETPVAPCGPPSCLPPVVPNVPNETAMGLAGPVPTGRNR